MQPLSGRRILVTRAAGQAGRLSQGLRALGAEPVELPLLEIHPPASFDSLDAALRGFSRFDWVIFSSANAVQAFDARADALEIPVGRLLGPKLAAIGRATAEAIEAAGLQTSFLPERYVAESLIEGMAELVPQKEVLLVRPAVARDLLPEALTAAGARVHIAEAYRNLLPEEAAGRARAIFAEGVEAAAFASSSSVTRLRELLQAAALPWPPPGTRAISIGPITSQTLRESGWEPEAEADPHDLPGLIAAIERAFQG